MVHAGIMMHNLKCWNNSACLNNGLNRNQAFYTQTGNQEFIIGIFGN